MQITREKKDYIRNLYLKGEVDIYYLADMLELRASTIRFYLNEFKIIAEQYPDKLTDFNFYIEKEKVIQEGTWHKNLISVLPGLVDFFFNSLLDTELYVKSIPKAASLCNAELKSFQF